MKLIRGDIYLKGAQISGLLCLLGILIVLVIPITKQEKQIDTVVGPCHDLKMEAQSHILMLRMQINEQKGQLKEAVRIIRNQHGIIETVVKKHNALLDEIDELKAGDK